MSSVGLLAFEPGFVEWNRHDCANELTVHTKRTSSVISEEFLAVLRSSGVIEAHLFGSTAHGTAGPDQ